MRYFEPITHELSEELVFEEERKGPTSKRPCTWTEDRPFRESPWSRVARLESACPSALKPALLFVYEMGVG